jgi:hypothetical protein
MEKTYYLTDRLKALHQTQDYARLIAVTQIRNQRAKNPDRTHYDLAPQESFDMGHFTVTADEIDFDYIDAYQYSGVLVRDYSKAIQPLPVQHYSIEGDWLFETYFRNIPTRWAE